jgi:drug/metabolite transporter (DMT)-like permease
MTPIAPRLTARFAALAPEARGALLLVCAMGLFALMDATGKVLMQRYPPFQIVWARYLGQALIVAVILAPRLHRVVRTGHVRLQLVRSALLFGATLCGFTAFSRLPLAEVTAVFQTAPLAITALAALVLREPVGPRRWAGVVIGFAGAMIVVRPGSAVFDPYALLPLVAAFLFASYSIATRFLGRDESNLTTLFYTAALGALIASAAVPFVWIAPAWGDLWLIGAMAGVGALGQFLLILAFSAAPAAAIAPFTYAGLLFAAALGFAIFGDAPDIWTMVGAAVIVGSGVYVWRREQIAARRAN